MATNDKYILNLMSDMITGQPVIRVYDKTSNYFSTAIFDYKLPAGSQSNFFVFPSFYLDIIFYRDEQEVSLIRMSEPRLTLDATNPAYIKNITDDKSVSNIN